MPRFSRPMPGGLCVHVVTRGNARATVFHSDADYAAMTRLMMDAQAVVQVEILAWCLMPNHMHFVIRPIRDGDLARWMHWLLTAHVQQHRVRHRTTGRIWQGRYKAFPIQTDRHLLTVLRYVERNPVRAELASHAIDWKWSSSSERRRAGLPRSPLAASPVPLPSPWLEWVDTPLTDAELNAIRDCARRDRPLGDRSWTRDVASRLDLLGTLRPRGRPRRHRHPLESQGEEDGDHGVSS
jgi:putative transposase